MAATDRPDVKVVRCTCGAWTYMGRTCMFCKAIARRAS